MLWIQSQIWIDMMTYESVRSLNTFFLYKYYIHYNKVRTKIQNAHNFPSIIIQILLCSYGLENMLYNLHNNVSSHLQYRNEILNLAFTMPSKCQTDNLWNKYVCSPIKMMHMSYPSCSLFGEVGITQGLLECHYNLHISIYMVYQFTRLFHSLIFKWIKLHHYWAHCSGDLNKDKL